MGYGVFIEAKGKSEMQRFRHADYSLSSRHSGVSLETPKQGENR